MSRIINLNSPGKIRSYHQRTIAEILRHIGSKATIDDEAKDMTATLVYSLREIYATVDHSAKAWEKRGYWMKADRFLREWLWAAEMAANVEDVVRNEAWDLLPGLLGQLLPHTSDIQVKVSTRAPDTWRGAYGRLMAEPQGEVPW